MGGVQRVLQSTLLSLWLVSSCAVMAQQQAPTPTDGLALRQAQPVSQVEPKPVAATAEPLESLFPQLTGRVVDTAQLLTPSAVLYLQQMLERLEQSTSDQVVVVTVPSLGGYSIEEFGVQLVRHWGIGQKDKNNGVLLLVARDERKVRIEVGSGLEGQINKMWAGYIINESIVPYFKDDLYSSGIIAGTTSIVRMLVPTDVPRVVSRSVERSWLELIDWVWWVKAVFFIVFLGILVAAFLGSWREKEYFPSETDKYTPDDEDDDSLLRRESKADQESSWSWSWSSSSSDVDDSSSSSSSDSSSDSDSDSNRSSSSDDS
ncbi:TPM domain-containing protein [Pseudomonas sp. TH03]|uniref:TPM domain-containing protein n=1 Tax=Pseudomonas sp. TH03 TaxID=2796369 RepID=UPI001912702B|nr:TPM domain-containing protein [Pseudomonas sp. TH03]MBK5550909.1 TPM domain-containing protein [Pseudomonas sp. TH03]